MKWFKAELHIHTVLSACADWEMTPRNIILKAKEVGVEVLAITDHNSAKNVGACIRAGQRENILVIPGIEVQTQEEVHIVSLFPTEEMVLSFEEWLKEYIPNLINNEEIFGVQVVVDEEDNVIEIDKRLLQISARVSIEDVVQKTRELRGIAYPAHVNREFCGIIPVLGFVPQDFPFKILEIGHSTDISSFLSEHPEFSEHVIIVSSDAHFLDSIGKGRTLVCLDRLDPYNLIEAIQDKRRVKIW
ncbi:MAG: PHP domain-containing protein [Synergistetes bacterium]|nr:PHP domain-containing protein [Synergistota bacterium]